MQSTKAEILQTISEVVLYQKDPCGKRLIEFLSGSSATEFAVLGPRGQLCREHLIDSFPDLAQLATEIMDMAQPDAAQFHAGNQNMLNELVDVPEYMHGAYSFPKPAELV